MSGPCFNLTGTYYQTALSSVSNIIFECYASDMTGRFLIDDFTFYIVTILYHPQDGRLPSLSAVVNSRSAGRDFYLPLPKVLSVTGGHPFGRWILHCRWTRGHVPTAHGPLASLSRLFPFVWPIPQSCRSGGGGRVGRISALPGPRWQMKGSR